jgi:hypothetical protein
MFATLEHEEEGTKDFVGDGDDSALLSISLDINMLQQNQFYYFQKTYTGKACAGADACFFVERFLRQKLRPKESWIPAGLVISSDASLGRGSKKRAGKIFTKNKK